MSGAFEVVIPGGPGPNVAQVVALLAAVLPDHGISVVTAPPDPAWSRDRGCDGECAAVERTRRLRVGALSLASVMAPPVVVLHQSGEVDRAAVHGDACVASVLGGHGLSADTVARSYGLVVHMTSGADQVPAAAAGVSLAGVGVDDARRWETALAGLWAAAPRRLTVDPSTDVAARAFQVAAAIAEAIGSAPDWTPRTFALAATQLGPEAAQVTTAVAAFDVRLEVTGTRVAWSHLLAPTLVIGGAA